MFSLGRACYLRYSRTLDKLVRYDRSLLTNAVGQHIWYNSPGPKQEFLADGVGKLIAGCI